VSEKIETPHPSRRALFSGAGAVGAAALLAACSDDMDSGSTSGSSPAASPPGGSGASPAASPSSGGADPAENFVAKTSQVPVGGGMVVADKGVVVTQPTAGTFKGFSSTCSHMQCPLAEVANGTINCNCHFSKFSIKDGSVVSPPATRALDPVEITVSGSDITLA
jgi:Rieske Fe-S protein